MNERIKELAEQAETKEVGYYFFDREKFAELIVGECIDVVSKKCASPTAYQALMEHFGVQISF